MSFKFKSCMYVLILVAIGLGCPVQNVQAMKRSHEQLTVSLDIDQKSAISSLPQELLRQLFVITNKATIIQVCKLWWGLANFKDNWRTFSGLNHEGSCLDPRDYIRMYYLLLKDKDNDFKRMEGLLKTDPYKEANFKHIASFFEKHPRDLASSDEMKKVLEQYGVATIKGCRFDQEPSKEDECFELNDIILCNEAQALNNFIKAGKGSVRSYTDIEKSLAVIVRFGSLHAIEKLLAHWKKSHSDENYTVCDELLGALFPIEYNTDNMLCRLSVLHLLLSSGAHLQGGSLEGDRSPLEIAASVRDYKALELLCTYGAHYKGLERFEIILDENSKPINKMNDHSIYLEVSPLRYAIYQGNASLVTLFLKFGTNSFEGEDQDSNAGDRPAALGSVLELAKKLGNEHIVDLIEVAQAVASRVVHAAELKMADQVAVGSVNASNYLIFLNEAGELVNEADSLFSLAVSPLMHGIYHGSSRAVAICLQAGHDPFENNPERPCNGDVFEVAKRQGNQQIIDLIEVARGVETRVKAALKNKAIDTIGSDTNTGIKA